MPPRIDLLIPLYNGREYLPALLSDIARVREHFANILFFDDASADGSADYLEENGYSVMRGKENRGQAFARNVLLHAASSDFIHFHDMDDPLHAKFFEEIIPSLEDSVICIGSFVAEYPDHVEPFPIAPSLAKGKLTPGDACHYFIHLNSLVLPRKAIVDVGGFPEKLRLHEDRFLMLRLADNAVRWRLCLSAPAVQRCHAKSTTATVGERFFWENRIIFFELALETMPNREWGFLVPEILEASRWLSRHRHFALADRGFALCESIGGDAFTRISLPERLSCQLLGFRRTYSFKHWALGLLRPCRKVVS
jgi:glycosyltransferase involved in cell wall biosynthesis